MTPSHRNVCPLEKAGHLDFRLRPGILFGARKYPPDARKLFDQLRAILAPDAAVLVVEPPLHVSQKAFARMIACAAEAGLTLVARPRIFLGKAVVLQSSLTDPR